MINENEHDKGYEINQNKWLKDGCKLFENKLTIGNSVNRNKDV